MADEKTPEELAAEAMAAANPPDAPAEEPPPDPPSELVDGEIPPQEATGNAIAGEGTAEAVGPEDPGIPDLEDAKTAAADEAAKIAAAAEENRPEPEAEPEPDPEPEETSFVVYKAVQGMPYPGQFLTVTVRVGEDDNGNPQYDTVVLEERVPTEVPASRAAALAEVESDHYAIESA